MFNSWRICAQVFGNSNRYKSCACMFNSRRICAQVALVTLTHEEVLDGVYLLEKSNLLRSVGDDFYLQGSL